MLENNARIIKHKVGLLNLAEELGNVSKACKVMRLSRDTFYRYKAAVESGAHPVNNIVQPTDRQTTKSQCPALAIKLKYG